MIRRVSGFVLTAASVLGMSAIARTGTLWRCLGLCCAMQILIAAGIAGVICLFAGD